MWSISHVRKKANELAHRLAKTALHQSLDHVWHWDSSDFIHNLVLAEQAYSD